MPRRLIGLETEFCVRVSSRPRSLRRPSKTQVCLAILSAVDEVVNTAPGEREGEPNFQRFVQNGGAFCCEIALFAPDDGLLESATPECHGPSQILLYQRAQETLISHALAIARERLEDAGYSGEIAVVKNCRDAEGSVYGAQENYEAEIARGWRLLAYRLGLTVLVPGIVVTAAALLVPAVLVVLACMLILWVFPLVRHWVGLGPYSDSSTDSSQPADGVHEDVPSGLTHALSALGMIALSPFLMLFMLLLRVTAFREIRAGAMGFLISRTIIAGAGTVHADGTFGLSERARSLSTTIRTSIWGHRKSVFDVGNLIKPLVFAAGKVVPSLVALFSRRQRLQLGISDSNCAQTAEFLKIGTTALVIDMAEAGFLGDAPRVRHPVAAVKHISKDPTLRARVALKGGGSMTAIELQQWYLRRADEFLLAGRATSLEYREVVTMWRATLAALEREPSSLLGRIDWVTKRALISGPGLGYAARKKIDIKYHELESGYFAMLERKGIAPVRLSAAQIRIATFRPPENTPAWHRGLSIAQAGDSRGQMRVSWRTRAG